MLFSNRISTLYKASGELQLSETSGPIDELIEKALRSIYKGDPSMVDTNLWKITVDDLNRAVDQEYSQKAAFKQFANKLKYHNSVFSAYKSAHQKTTLRHLKQAASSESFTEFRKRALEVTADYNKNWLKTEFKAAKMRVRSAQQYQNALQDADIYPNIEYMPSRSVNPREEHKSYYGTILPIDHPWWDTHLPPTTWGCQCWWRNTDSDTSPVPASMPDDVAPGMDINPGKTGRIFSDSHPYIAEMEHSTPEILKQNIAAIHNRNVEELTYFLPHQSKGCVYSFDKLGAEYSSNTRIAKVYASRGNAVQIFGQKNIDASVNGSWNEFKSPGPKYDNIDQGIRKANSQLLKRGIKGDITLELNSIESRGTILRAIKGRINRIDKCMIENIHFVSNGNYLGQVTIKEILSDKLPF